MEKLRAALREARCTNRVTDIASPMRQALTLLQASSKPNREIYIVSDMQKSGWEGLEEVLDAGDLDIKVLAVDLGGEDANACVEDIDYRHPRGIDRPFMSTLASCQWVEHHQNLAITGPTGSGKTWLACALGNQACRQGLSVRYLRLPRLFETLRIAHGDGSYAKLMTQLAKTDLLITPGAHRQWVGLSGHNIPSFELFTSPDWRGTQGVYHANQPSYRSGNYVEGVTLEFKKGRVTTARAEQGEHFLRQQLAMDPGASRVGEFSLTDRRFSKITKFMANTLYDENFGGRQGNCHIAVGSSYSDTFQGASADLSQERKKELGFNTSALHWDLVNTERKRVTAHLKGGQTVTIYENGQFCY